MDILATILTIVLTSVLTGIIMYMALNYTLNKFGGSILEFFDKGIVKQGMSILGKKSGESRRNKALENEIALGVVENTIGKWKIPLSLVGIDLEELMEKYEPMELLGALNTFLPMLQGAGIDVKGLMGNITGQPGQGQGSNIGSA